jgi:hypothetical protein
MRSIIFSIFLAISTHALAATCFKDCQAVRPGQEQNKCYQKCAPEIADFCHKRFPTTEPASEGRIMVLSDCFKYSLPCHDNCKDAPCREACLGN